MKVKDVMTKRPTTIGAQAPVGAAPDLMRTRPARSPKAGRPPVARAVPARVRRRRTSARAAFRKDTTIHQAADGPRVIWAAGKPKLKNG